MYFFPHQCEETLDKKPLKEGGIYFDSGFEVQPQQREVAVVVTEEMRSSLLIFGRIGKPRQKRKQGLEVNLKGHDYHRNLTEIP